MSRWHKLWVSTPGQQSRQLAVSQGQAPTENRWHRVYQDLAPPLPCAPYTPAPVHHHHRQKAATSPQGCNVQLHDARTG